MVVLTLLFLKKIERIGLNSRRFKCAKVYKKIKPFKSFKFCQN